MVSAMSEFLSPRMAVITIFTAAAVAKIYGLLTGAEHPVMGKGGRLPSWCLPLTTLYEIAIVAFMFSDEALGLLLAFGLLGGIASAQPGMVFRTGILAVIPFLLVTACMVLTFKNYTQEQRMSPTLNLQIDGLYLGLATVMGMMLGVILEALKPRAHTRMR